MYSHVVCYLPITTQQATPKLSGLKMSTLIVGFEGWELGVTQRLPVAQGFSGGLAGLWAGLWPQMKAWVGKDPLPGVYG